MKFRRRFFIIHDHPHFHCLHISFQSSSTCHPWRRGATISIITSRMRRALPRISRQRTWQGFVSLTNLIAWSRASVVKGIYPTTSRSSMFFPLNHKNEVHWTLLDVYVDVKCVKLQERWIHKYVLCKCDQSGCRTGNGEKLSSSLARQDIKSDVV